MRCDSWVSFLACTLASPCFGHEPKVKVATILLTNTLNRYLPNPTYMATPTYMVATTIDPKKLTMMRK
jgi:hypothetical protein